MELCLVGAGCSFSSEGPLARTPSQPSKCRSFRSPLVDTGVVAVGALTVATAGSQEPDAAKVERIAGYTTMALFGASAIYGFIVVGQCRDQRDEDIQHGEQGSESEARPRPPFPGSVYDFAFRSRPAAAEQVCRGKGRAWTMQGTTGECALRSGPNSEPRARLTFDAGLASQITVVYDGNPENLNQSYGAIYASMRKTFGEPQVPPARPSAACAASLAQCLSDGERPAGASWHWADGSIDLVPNLSDGKPLIELRYTREEPLTR